MANYHSLSGQLQDRIRADRSAHAVNPYAFRDENVIRRRMDHDKANLWRPAFIRDCEKILHNPYYNRYSDKTQVLSGYQNDDISRRALHVQLVSRIARNIGQLLGLNVDLIEAISLGHDIGHTPFGHAGERFLNRIYHEHTGRYFNHNVQSVRVLDKMVNWNISLQVLDGVLCHNGEMEMSEYRPAALSSFAEFDAQVEECYTDPEANKRQIPSTLEACVMRVSDIIAYLGKDRQDAKKVEILSGDEVFSGGEIGSTNAEIINNMIVNIVENSYGKPFICMERVYYEAFSRAKQENYELIYGNPRVDSIYKTVEPMFEAIYEELLSQAKEHDKNSILYKHHVAYLRKDVKFQEQYLEEEPDQVVVDFISSMTDDYLLALYHELFPEGKYRIEFKGYFG
ncbi:MAG: HD domain-containing protein [Roseburia sp.]|nr:HD domain-containing protein [Roseburia sp.]